MTTMFNLNQYVRTDTYVRTATYVDSTYVDTILRHPPTLSCCRHTVVLCVALEMSNKNRRENRVFKEGDSDFGRYVKGEKVQLNWMVVVRERKLVKLSH